MLHGSVTAEHRTYNLSIVSQTVQPLHYDAASYFSRRMRIGLGVRGRIGPLRVSKRVPCRISAPVLHVQLPTSQRDATRPVVQHLHRSSRRNNGTITSRLFHCQYHGHPPRRKMPFRRRRRRRCRDRQSKAAAARHWLPYIPVCDEVRHNLSSADVVDAASIPRREHSTFTSP